VNYSQLGSHFVDAAFGVGDFLKNLERRRNFSTVNDYGMGDALE
jgi:hypothetical protein